MKRLGLACALFFAVIGCKSAPPVRSERGDASEGMASFYGAGFDGRLTANGEKFDRHGATGVRGIFAAGDATDGHDKQIVIAVGEGATAALAAFEYLVKQV